MISHLVCVPYLQVLQQQAAHWDRLGQWTMTVSSSLGHRRRWLSCISWQATWVMWGEIVPLRRMEEKRERRTKGKRTAVAAAIDQIAYTNYFHVLQHSLNLCHRMRRNEWGGFESMH